MDPLKAAWKGEDTNTKSTADIKKMLKENKHPVLKKIRTQMIIEILAFSVIGVVYYDFFDGHQKPLYANIILVVSLLLVIVHNVIGYLSARNPVKGSNMRASLEKYLSDLKIFARLSILSRILYAAGLLTFFISVITITATKQWIIAGVIIVFLIQIGILVKLWQNRIRGISITVGNLKMGE
ncbi:hypothetical protein GFS24_06355 [Chitinophaga sp. SYP-B3965]|uniref:hypothetical protein n=1 Tax=Chitinophaga sp. SYP-B3965 TaxID=2663120 RepID=UPI0012999182|nr:hypothetical protein [Chitinophaga sp. SYP-B3965]MRG44726.1 hypothetical protein [Chitinophaga sp. SYP-B3965]